MHRPYRPATAVIPGRTRKCGVLAGADASHTRAALVGATRNAARRGRSAGPPRARQGAAASVARRCTNDASTGALTSETASHSMPPPRACAT